MNSLNTIGSISICLLTIALAGCSTVDQSGIGSSSAVAPSEENVANACPRLKRVISDAPNKFRTVKGKALLITNMTLWEAQPVFPTADCEIWEWAAGNTEYVCKWKREDEATARARYNRYRSIVTKCLGDTWHPSEKLVKTGPVTQFTSPEDKTNVYLLYSRDGGVLSRAWRTTLVVGDKLQRMP